MKILIVTRENTSDKKYGLGKSIQRIAQEFRLNGHEVTYFSQTDCEKAHNKWQPKLIRLLKPLGILAGAFSERLVQGWQAAKVQRHNRHTHVWFQDPWLVFGFKLYQRLTLSFSNQVAIGISEHGLGSFTWAVSQDGIDFSPRVYRALINYERKTLLKADWVWCPSHIALTSLLRDLHLTQCPNHFKAIHYGKPDNAVTRSTADLTTLSQGVKTVLAMGRIAPVKNYPLLIETLAELEHQYNLKAQLVILGDGDPSHLINYAEALKLSLPPIIKTVDDVFKELERADVYISACNVESFGMANREAVASATPSILAAGGAACEVIDDGAWLLPPDKYIFAKALNSLFSNSELSTFWKTQAIQATKKWPCWQTVYQQYEQTLLAIKK